MSDTQLAPVLLPAHGAEVISTLFASMGVDDDPLPVGSQPCLVA